MKVSTYHILSCVKNLLHLNINRTLYKVKSKYKVLYTYVAKATVSEFGY
jgi:hypothetical protein